MAGLVAEPEAGEGRIKVSCLGAFVFSVDGVPVEGWQSGKARALFQYLVNHRGRPIPRSVLIGALWPDPDASTPGTSLKVAVHALRQVLSRVNGRQLSLIVHAHESGYQLSVDDLWLDVEAFERAFTQARRLESRGTADPALELYGQAAELYRGDFLEESWEDWVVFRREALKDDYLFALARLADAALAAGDFYSCIERCRQLLAADRCREDTYRMLMLCHARLGQRGRVRAWYDLCVRTLRSELDAAPEPETERVYRLALRNEL